MSETVVIILSFAEDKTAEFERRFAAEIVPMWKEFHAQGRMIRASLTPATVSPKGSEKVREYLLLVEVPSRQEHEAFDHDPRFLSFLEDVKPWQPIEPQVWLGNTLHKL